MNPEPTRNPLSNNDKDLGHSSQNARKTKIISNISPILPVKMGKGTRFAPAYAA